MATRAVYGDVVAEVGAELPAALARAERAGVRRERMVLDPGIGFAKTAEQSWRCWRGLARLRRPWRARCSSGRRARASSASVTGAPVEERLPGTLAAVTACVLAGVELLRVHDVAPARQAARVAAAIRDAAARSRGLRVAERGRPRVAGAAVW